MLDVEPLPFCVAVGEDGRCDLGIRYKEESMGSVCKGSSACRNVSKQIIHMGNIVGTHAFEVGQHPTPKERPGLDHARDKLIFFDTRDFGVESNHAGGDEVDGVMLKGGDCLAWCDGDNGRDMTFDKLI